MQRTFSDIDITIADTCTSTSNYHDTNMTHFIQLLQLLLAYTVQYNNKDEHINTILSLEEQYQSILMEMVEEILSTIATDTDSNDNDDNMEATSNTVSPSNNNNNNKSLIKSSSIKKIVTTTRLHTISGLTSPSAW